MPRIPRYEQERLPTSETGEIQVSPNAFGTSGKMLQAAGDIIGEQAQKFKEAFDYQQVSKAKIEANKRLTTLENEVYANPDQWTDQNKINETLKNITTDTSDMISDNQLRMKFQTESEFDFTNTSQKINYTVTKYKIDSGKVATMEEIDQKVEQLFSESDYTIKSARAQQINSIIDSAVQAGYFDQEQGYKLKESTRERINKGQIGYDIQNRPEWSLQELQKGNFGAYKNVSFDERNEYIKDAQNQIKTNQEKSRLQIAIAQNATESNIVDRMFRNEVNAKEIEDLHAKGQISDSFAISARKQLLSPLGVNAGNDPLVYVELARRVADVKDRSAGFIDPREWFNRPGLEETSKLMADILEANANGNLSKSEAKNLMDDIQKRFSKVTKPVFTEAVNALKRQSQVYTDKTMQQKAYFDMTKMFMDRVRAGENPTEAIRTVAVDYLDKEVNAAIAATPAYNIPKIRTTAAPPELTEENITFNMQKYNLSREEVIKRYKAKYGR